MHLVKKKSGKLHCLVPNPKTETENSWFRRSNADFRQKERKKEREGAREMWRERIEKRESESETRWLGERRGEKERWPWNREWMRLKRLLTEPCQLSSITTTNHTLHHKSTTFSLSPPSPFILGSVWLFKTTPSPIPWFERANAYIHYYNSKRKVWPMTINMTQLNTQLRAGYAPHSFNTNLLKAY